MTLRLAHETSPIELAWIAYDNKMLDLVAAYRLADEEPDVGATRRLERMQLLLKSERLLRAWRKLFLAEFGGDPGEAA